MFKIIELRNGCYMAQFDELLRSEYSTTTNVLVVDAETRVFICDTYLGPSYMHEILRELNLPADKPKVVLNSHYHWDHVWGNAYFHDSLVVAHHLCYDHLVESAAKAYTEYKRFRPEEFPITLPNLTFADEIRFPEDGVTIFHSPGHTVDSISLFSREHKLVYAADNVEAPIPTYMENQDFSTYIRTVRRYLEIDPDLYVPGHDDVLTKEDIQGNRAYLQALLSGDVSAYEEEPFRRKHLTNVSR